MKVILPNPPEGYEQEAELRYAARGEYFLMPDGPEIAGTFTASAPVIVLTPKKPERWRAEPGGDYWTLDDYLLPLKREDHRTEFANAMWRSGIYVKTMEEAAELGGRIQATVDAFHAEQREEGR